MSLVNVTTKRTFSLSQGDVLMIVADYLNKNEGLDVKPEDLNLRIDDSVSGDYYGPNTPAKIREISVTVSE